MQFYQHNFACAEDYLHHRPPYLLVDRIVSVTEIEVVATKMITGGEYFIEGHFPGAPIFPGAMMQELSTQTAAVLIAAKYNPMRHYNTHDPSFNEFALGVLVRVKYAKYKGFARPGDTLVAHVALNEHVGNMFDFSSTISVGEKPIMRNSFRLTNIESSLLHAD
jgi:3-hydroxyacyl-[acyl-carrier-protein] dehydratase